MKGAAYGISDGICDRTPGGACRKQVTWTAKLMELLDCTAFKLRCGLQGLW